MKQTRSRRCLKKCATCAHASFDDTFGEYKTCKVTGKRILNPNEITNCKNHENKKD